MKNESYKLTSLLTISLS